MKMEKKSFGEKVLDKAKAIYKKVRKTDSKPVKKSKSSK